MVGTKSVRRDAATPKASRALRLSEFLPYRLSVLSNTVSRRIADRYEREFGLSVRQWRVMAVLGEESGLGAGEIAKRTAMDKVAVSRAVADLVDKGLVRRRASQNDGRLSHLFLSADGRTVYARVAHLALAYERELLSGLSERQRGALFRAMDILADTSSPDEPLW